MSCLQTAICTDQPITQRYRDTDQQTNPQTKTPRHMQTLKHVGCWIANTQFQKPIDWLKKGLVSTLTCVIALIMKQWFGASVVALGHGMSENLKNLVMLRTWSYKSSCRSYISKKLLPCRSLVAHGMVKSRLWLKHGSHLLVLGKNLKNIALNFLNF